MSFVQVVTLLATSLICVMKSQGKAVFSQLERSYYCSTCGSLVLWVTNQAAEEDGADILHWVVNRSKGRWLWYSGSFSQGITMECCHEQPESVISLLLKHLGNSGLIPVKLIDSGLHFVNSKLQSIFIYLPMCSAYLVENASPFLMCTCICVSS